jgi:hypothetical protein
MNVGFWSSAAEDWYQSRRALIHSGHAGLKSGEEWHSNLKYQRKGAPLAEKHEAAAVKFLDGVEYCD